MRCPHCAAHVLERWQSLYTVVDALGERLENPKKSIPNTILDGSENQELTIEVSWMECPNVACQRVIITIATEYFDPDDAKADEDSIVSSEKWFAYPRRSSDRPVDPAVPTKMANDYREAASILDDSPKASAAIARRILADILNEFGGYKDFQLSRQIEQFADGVHHPSALRENTKYLVQIGNFAAQTQKETATQQIIEVEPGEAEWTLDVIDGMFDYFIVGPARDRARRAAVDAKLEATGRKPIRSPK